MCVCARRYACSANRASSATRASPAAQTVHIQNVIFPDVWRDCVRFQVRKSLCDLCQRKLLVRHQQRRQENFLEDKSELPDQIEAMHLVVFDIFIHCHAHHIHHTTARTNPTTRQPSLQFRRLHHTLPVLSTAKRDVVEGVDELSTFFVPHSESTI